MASFKLRHLCFTAVLFSIAFSSCRGQGGGTGGGAVVPGTQDAIQIVAQAALCFDNKTVINGCLQAMGINVTGNGTSANTSAGSGARAPSPAPAAAANGSTATICSGPCFGQMTMIMGCVNGILGNIPGYSPGLMQGVQAIFQMACGNVNGQGGGAGAGNGTTSGAGSGGASGGATNVSSSGGSHMAVSSPSQPTSSAYGPTASLREVCSSVLIIWAAMWVVL